MWKSEWPAAWKPRKFPEAKPSHPVTSPPETTIQCMQMCQSQTGRLWGGSRGRFWRVFPQGRQLLLPRHRHLWVRSLGPPFGAGSPRRKVRFGFGAGRDGERRMKPGARKQDGFVWDLCEAILSQEQLLGLKTGQNVGRFYGDMDKLCSA